MKKFWYGLLGLSALALASLPLIAMYAWDYYESPGPLAQETTVIFKRGTGFRPIVLRLEEQGVIEHPLIFKGMAALMGQGRRFKAGEYRFPEGASPRLIMEMLAEGRVVAHKLTVPEGLKVREVVELLKKEPSLEGEVPEGIKEGSLLPETYHFVYGDTRADLVARMQAEMNKTLNALWAARAEGLPLASPEQALVLASIVEKETNIEEERGRVAAVFINRLKKPMRLQSDPTTVYGLERQLGAPMSRPLTFDDLKSKTPYNTYVIDGLPPTPIANPGSASIAAVLNPPQTKDLYFVATGNGGHVFSETLKAHNQNVSAYRKVQREKRRQTKNDKISVR